MSNDWIENTLGENPIPNAKGGEFEVLFRNGSSKLSTVDSTYYNWRILRINSDIVAYRHLSTSPQDALQLLNDQGYEKLSFFRSVTENNNETNLAPQALQEFYEEAKTNTRPWEVFEISYDGSKFAQLEDFYSISDFYDPSYVIRRKKKIGWKWLVKNKIDNDVILTNNLFATSDSCLKCFSSPENWEVLRKIEETAVEIE